MRERDLTMELGETLRGLGHRSAPLNRAARHLLRRDMSETYHFALLNPESLSATESAMEEMPQ